LKSLKEKIGIIGVAGKYRSGKSFLLNRLILNLKYNGFGVGSTIHACTKVRQLFTHPLLFWILI
jgi:hypothetical protein